MSFDCDMIIGTAGHIDHGKTALVHALTGVDTDRLPAEKARGITIELGFAALNCGKNRLSLVDVPGHERFIRNMLAGATGLDLALLVVAADDGVMPQTCEHLEILKLLGLTGGVIALTKCDLVDPDWLELVETDIRNLTNGSFLQNQPIVRTAVPTGLGIDTLKNVLAEISEKTVPRVDSGPFRMAVDRVFSRPGHGTIVTGTVLSGTVRVGDDLEWLPACKTVRVRGLHRHDAAVESLGRGARAAINLTGVHNSEIVRGDELAEPGYLRTTRILSAQVTASADAPGGLKHRTRYRLHLGTTEVAATLGLLDRNRLEPGESAPAQLFTDCDVTAVSGQRFVLRQESPAATLGGGRVLEPTAKKSRKRDPVTLARLGRLMSMTPTERLLAAIDSLGIRHWTDLDLSRSSGVPLSQIGEHLAGLARSGVLTGLAIGSHRTVPLTSESLAVLESRVLKAIGRLHAKKPRQSVVPRSHLPAELPDLDDRRVIDSLLTRLLHDGRIIGDQTAVALASFRPGLSHSERKLKADLASTFQRAGWAPPEVSELPGQTVAEKKVTRELLDLLADEGRLVAISPTLYLDAESEREMRRRARKTLQESGSMTMADLRDLLGTTRKYAVPLGEYLDRSGLTIREGDVRTLNPLDAEDRPDE